MELEPFPTLTAIQASSTSPYLDRVAGALAQKTQRKSDVLWALSAGHTEWGHWVCGVGALNGDTECGWH